jgi:integrase
VRVDPPKLARVITIEKFSEKGNARKGKFTPAEAELVAVNLPHYMADVARFGYQTGTRAGEILELRWTHLDGDAISVPGAITKNREARSIVLTPEIQEILDRRRRDMRAGCDLIFHHDGKPIADYHKCWQTACVALGLGALYCRAPDGGFTSNLDAKKACPRCARRNGKPRSTSAGSSTISAALPLMRCGRREAHPKTA